MDFNIRASASVGFDPDKRVEKSEDFEYKYGFSSSDNNVENEFRETEKDFLKSDCKSCGKFFTFDGGHTWYRRGQIVLIEFKPEQKIIIFHFPNYDITGSYEIPYFNRITIVKGSVEDAFKYFLNVIEE